MGYSRQAKVYRLRFEDDDMDGLEVRAKSVPLGAFLEMVELTDIDTRSIAPEDARKVDRLFKAFSQALISWNLEEPQGTPVPATFEGLRSQDIDFTMRILRAWIQALTSVPDPLAAGSSNGGRSLERSIPMEAR